MDEYYNIIIYLFCITSIIYFSYEIIKFFRTIIKTKEMNNLLNKKTKKTQKSIDKFLKKNKKYNCKQGICYGLRKQDTHHGTWTGAYVCCILKDENIISAYFENETESIITYDTWSEYKNDYNRLLTDDWLPMGRYDIKRTANI